jgi:aryl-alcohol dehydrogenase-like predicted oxidoreductase
MSLPSTRRSLIGSGAAVAALIGAAAWWGTRRDRDAKPDLPSGEPEIARTVGHMPYRRFGKTGLQVSEVGFGAWPIGGQSYGAVERAESLRALARAEELGCNFVDTAMVYGESESVIGEFLRGRRDKWIVATKYSGQQQGMTATLERQLKRLGTEAVDYYQLHWDPVGAEEILYEELYRVKKSGKARFVGVSLQSVGNIDHVIEHTHIDGVQLPFSLLDPVPFLPRQKLLRKSGLAVVARSSLREGFLTGKFRRDATFSDPNDQRSKWSHAEIAAVVDQVERLRFLEAETGTMLAAAVRYPLSYPEVSTVILGTKSEAYADSNFGPLPGGRLSASSLERVSSVQRELGVWSRRERLMRLLQNLT